MVCSPVNVIQDHSEGLQEGELGQEAGALPLPLYSGQQHHVRECRFGSFLLVGPYPTLKSLTPSNPPVLRLARWGGLVFIYKIQVVEVEGREKGNRKPDMKDTANDLTGKLQKPRKGRGEPDREDATGTGKETKDWRDRTVDAGREEKGKREPDRKEGTGPRKEIIGGLIGQWT